MSRVPGGVGTDAELQAQGWVRRFLAGPDRAREAERSYTAAGFEVLLLSLSPEDFAEECQGCAATVCATYVVVYTRLRRHP